MNRHLILAEIINKGPLSRAAIAKESGLTKATVSAIVQTLLDEQLVTEIGSDDTSRGRSPSCSPSARRPAASFPSISVWITLQR